MITAVVTSDNHLGAHYARLRLDYLEERRRYLQRAFARVVDAAIAGKVDLFLHTGNLFDRPDPRNADRVFAARQFARLREAGIPVFAVTGDRDTPRWIQGDGAIPPHEEFEALDALHLFRFADRFTSAAFALRETSICIRGLSAAVNRAGRGCPLRLLARSETRTAEIEIILLHGEIESAPAGPDALRRAHLEMLQADVICVGHTRRPSKKRLKSGALLVVPGATEHIQPADAGHRCGYQVLRLTPGQPATAEFVPLSVQPIRTLAIDIESLEGEPNLQRALEAHLQAAARPDCLLFLQLRGRISRDRFRTLDLSALNTFGHENGVSFTLSVDELDVLPSVTQVTAETGVEIAAALRQAAAELMPDEDGLTDRALERLLEAAA